MPFLGNYGLSKGRAARLLIGVAPLVAGAISCGNDARPPPSPNPIADASAAPPVVVTAGPYDVSVVFTADNAYGFGWGDVKSLLKYQSPPNSRLAGDIFNCPVTRAGTVCSSPTGCGPEAFVVPELEAPPSAYLYVVAWSDQSTTQGVLGQFKRGGAPTLYTGDDVWEVCATGVEFDPSRALHEGPSKPDIEAKIALCNLGDPSLPSRGWVNKTAAVTAGALGNVVVGEDNARNRPSDPGGLPTDGVFPIACQKNDDGTAGIDSVARWMWYQPPGYTAERAFSDNQENGTQTYLIFRVKAVDIPLPPVR